MADDDGGAVARRPGLPPQRRSSHNCLRTWAVGSYRGLPGVTYPPSRRTSRPFYLWFGFYLDLACRCAIYIYSP